MRTLKYMSLFFGWSAFLLAMAFQFVVLRDLYITPATEMLPLLLSLMFGGIGLGLIFIATRDEEPPQ